MDLFFYCGDICTKILVVHLWVSTVCLLIRSSHAPKWVQIIFNHSRDLTNYQFFVTMVHIHLTRVQFLQILNSLLHHAHKFVNPVLRGLNFVFFLCVWTHANFLCVSKEVIGLKTCPHARTRIYFFGPTALSSRLPEILLQKSYS